MVCRFFVCITLGATLACGSNGQFTTKNTPTVANDSSNSGSPSDRLDNPKSQDSHGVESPSPEAAPDLKVKALVNHQVSTLETPILEAGTLSSPPPAAPSSVPPPAAPAAPTVPVSPGNPSAPEVSVPACPPQNANILVLDFQSGWWAGDGGDFVDRIVNGLQLNCHGTVKIEYHHFVKSATTVVQGSEQSRVVNSQLIPPATTISAGSPLFSQAFGDATWSSYTQIWLLSGSSLDGADVPITDPFFANVLSHIANSKASLFIGVGFGSISHANVLTQSLTLGALFKTSQPQGNILNPMGGVKLASSLNANQITSSSSLFGNGVQSIADEVVVNGTPAHGDNIVQMPGFATVATDHLNQNTLAVGSVNGRKVVLDADLPRYYAAWSNLSDDTMQLLRNIVAYLAN